MTSRSHNLALALMTCFIVLISTSLGWPDEPSTKFVANDYLEALTKIANRYAECDGECNVTILRARKSSVASHLRRSFAISGGNGRLIETNLDHRDNRQIPDAIKKESIAKKYESAFVYNRDYSFLLSRLTPESAFAIEMLENGPERGKRLHSQGARNPANFFTHLYVTPIEAIVTSPTFRVDSVREVAPLSTDRKIRVDFTRPMETKGKARGSHISSGWFVFSPVDKWMMQEYGFVETLNAKPSVQGTTVGIFEYTRGKGGELLPLKYICRIFNDRFDTDPASKGVMPILSEEYEFTKFRFGETPTREFTLQSFGLPEFAEPAAKRLNRPFPWWIVAASVGAFGLAAILRRLARRSRTPGPEPLA